MERSRCIYFWLISLKLSDICGIDEAGRGPLAGPMVVAGVVLASAVEGARDSKKLTESKREALYGQIIANSKYKIVFKSHIEIDEKGLSQCLHEALEEIKNTLVAKQYIMDGNTNFGVLGIDTIIKGDDKIPAISCASILAKVSRDRFMHALDSQYDIYEFGRHKGYGTKLHKELIGEYGLSDIHRKSFQIS